MCLLLIISKKIVVAYLSAKYLYIYRMFLKI